MSPLTPPPLPRTPHLLTAREQALSPPTLRLTSLSLSQRRCRKKSRNRGAAEPSAGTPRAFPSAQACGFPGGPCPSGRGSRGARAALGCGETDGSARLARPAVPVAPCRQRLPGALGPACPLRAISGATSRQPSHCQRRVSFRASRAAGRLCFLRVSGSGGPWGHAPRGGGAFLRVCTGPGTAGLRAWWPGGREQVDQTCADTEPP